jgi:hypothetical protein
MHITLTRAVATVLAVLALAAPVALARPGGPASAAAAHARAEAERLANPGPVYWSYDYEAPSPQAQPPRATTSHDDGLLWRAILFALVGASIAGAGTAMVIRRGRARRTWATA